MLLTMGPVEHQFHQRFQDALGRGDMFALFERTREAIEAFPDDPDARYYQALAMARLGDPNAALRLYERNRVEEIGTEDAVALKGRLLKDLAVRTAGAEQVELFRQSSEAYRQANKLSDGYFSGINAATTSFLAGDRDEAVQAGVNALLAAISGGSGGLTAAGTQAERSEDSSRAESRGRPMSYLQMVLVGLVVLGFLVLLLTNPGLAMYLLFSILSGGRGGGGGGGGFSAGGGSSGGGGASGRW